MTDREMTNQEHQRKLRILNIQNNAILRLGLRSVLERHGMQIVGESVERKEIISLVTSKQPDVILFDGTLTFCDSYQPYSAAEMVTHLRQEGSRGIFVFAPCLDEESLFQFMRSGAAAYEPATLAGDELVEKVQRVANGEYLISGEVLQPRAQKMCVLPTSQAQKDHIAPDEESVQDRFGLSERHIEVLQCIMRGLSNKQIARHLGISDQTVKNHLTTILHLFSVCDRTAAVVTALRHGLIPFSDALPDAAGTAMPESSHTQEAVAV